MQGIDLRPSLALVLEAGFDGQRAQRRQLFAENRIAGDLAVDVADEPAEAAAQELVFAIGALELMGVRIALGRDHGPFGGPEKALPQPNPMPPGEANQLLDRLVDHPGVGRMGHRLGLDRGVDRNSLEILGRQGAGLAHAGRRCRRRR